MNMDHKAEQDDKKIKRDAIAAMLTLGSLFDGIGGFPLAASHYGITALWASEIETAPISIARRHFPDTEHLGDVTKIDGAKVRPVDIITFGSPCQDLSVAGRRAGLAGSRSGLFGEAIRIIDEMRKTTNGLYPTWAIWENVPGALSSNNGLDFRAVLQSITDSEIPMPPSGRWANAGMVRGRRRDIAWRILDAQFWGVPQRRNRIFLVGHFGGERASQILFERESLRGHNAPSEEAREGTAADIMGGFGETGFRYWQLGIQSLRSGGCRNLAGTVVTASGVQQNASGEIRMGNVAYTLNTNSNPSGRNAPLVAIYDARGNGNGDIAPMLMGDHQNRVTDYAHTNGGYSLNTTHPVRIGYTVRRLTPVECERLMGFPDNWTAYGHDGNAISDSARYKAIGNSVAIPCVDYIMAGIAEIAHIDK